MHQFSTIFDDIFNSWTIRILSALWWADVTWVWILQGVPACCQVVIVSDVTRIFQNCCLVGFCFFVKHGWVFCLALELWPSAKVWKEISRFGTYLSIFFPCHTAKLGQAPRCWSFALTLWCKILDNGVRRGTFSKRETLVSSPTDKEKRFQEIQNNQKMCWIGISLHQEIEVIVKQQAQIYSLNHEKDECFICQCAWRWY